MWLAPKVRLFLKCNHRSNWTFLPLMSEPTSFLIYVGLFYNVLSLYRGWPINFKPEHVAQYSAIWRTYIVHICVEWFKTSWKSARQNSLMLKSVQDTACIVKSLVANPCQLNVSIFIWRWGNMGEWYMFNEDILGREECFLHCSMRKWTLYEVWSKRYWTFVITWDLFTWASW